MAKIIGNGGSVVTTGTTSNWGAGVVVGSVEEWSADVDEQLVEVTTFGSAGFREYVNGNKSCKGSLKMIADGTTALTLFGATNPTVDLNLTGTSRKISGTAVIGNMKVGPVNAKSTDPIYVTFDFTYTSTFTIA